MVPGTASLTAVRVALVHEGPPPFTVTVDKGLMVILTGEETVLHGPEETVRVNHVVAVKTPGE